MRGCVCLDSNEAGYNTAIFGMKFDEFAYRGISGVNLLLSIWSRDLAAAANASNGQTQK